MKTIETETERIIGVARNMVKQGRLAQEIADYVLSEVASHHDGNIAIKILAAIAALALMR